MITKNSFIPKYRNSYTTSVKTNTHNNRFISSYNTPKNSQIIISGKTREQNLVFVSVLNKK